MRCFNWIVAALVPVLSIGLFSGSASAYNRSVYVTNNSSSTIMELYGSNVGSGIWDNDILGNHVLRPGETVVVDFNDQTGYCRFDVMAIHRDGSASVGRRIDICTVAEITIE